jgi:hypothetical protein
MTSLATTNLLSYVSYAAKSCGVRDSVTDVQYVTTAMAAANRRRQPEGPAADARLADPGWRGAGASCIARSGCQG